MKVKTIRLYKDNEEVIVDENRVDEFAILGYQPEPVGSEDTKSSDGGRAKARKAKDEPVPQDASETGGA